jgi:hypothetical protein
VEVVFSASPLNTHYDRASVQSKLDYIKERWVYIPDTSGRMHLVDMEIYKAETVQPLFDAEKEVKFYLFTRDTQKQELKKDLGLLQTMKFPENHQVRFTIHGWNGDETSAVNDVVIKEYLKQNDYNFSCIMVDWSKGGKISRRFFFYDSQIHVNGYYSRNIRLHHSQLQNL